MTDQNGDTRPIEEVSAKVVKLFNGNANYAYGSNERVELYKSIVNLVISTRAKAQLEARIDELRRLQTVQFDPNKTPAQVHMFADNRIKRLRSADTGTK